MQEPDYLALYNSGLSLRQVATATGTNYQTVKRRLIAADYKPRGRIAAACLAKARRTANNPKYVPPEQLAEDEMPELETRDKQITWLKNKVILAVGRTYDLEVKVRRLEEKLHLVITSQR